MEFFDPIIDFLGQRRGLLQRYNWQIAFGIVAGVLAAIAVRERSKNWQRMKEDHRETMREKPLRAIIFSTEKEQEVQYSASISLCSAGYQVTIEKDDHVMLDEVISSLDDVEVFLRKNTKFILTDFQ